MIAIKDMGKDQRDEADMLMYIDMSRGNEMFSRTKKQHPARQTFPAPGRPT